MTNSLSRLLALPFALILIFSFTSGGLDLNGPKTIAIMFSLISLALIYVFNSQINTWWWKRKMPSLDKTLKAWLSQYSKFYIALPQNEKVRFERRLSTFMHVKNFTLKAEREYQLEEDIKAIISHEFIRLTFQREEFLFENIEHFVVYNHAFGSPAVQVLHTLEVYDADKVVILSKEQLINGFFQPEQYVNISLLAAVQCFITEFPRLQYPDVTPLDPASITEDYGIDIKVILHSLGSDWINRLDLIIFCYFSFPEKSATLDKERYDRLNEIFGNN